MHAHTLQTVLESLAEAGVSFEQLAEDGFLEDARAHILEAASILSGVGLAVGSPPLPSCWQ